MTITQEDRQSAEKCACLTEERLGIVAEAFAAHRIAAEHRIVEWLRSDTGKGSEEGADWASTFADAIEADAHLEPRDPHHRQPAQ